MHCLAKRALSLLILITASLLSFGASAAPFSVNVATGGAGLPVARMKVVLWGGYTAGVTASVTVGATSGSASLPAGTDTAAFVVGSDVGKLTHVGNNLVLDIQLLSLVTSATNLCTPAAGVPASVQYTINLTGGGAVTHYGLAGYSASSEVACTCATRRKASGVAWQAGSVPAGVERRIPFAVMTVLDESGSMLSPPQGGAGPSKWTLTAQAMGEFIDVLSGEADSPDQLGLVFFDHSVNPFLNAGSPWFPKASFPTVDTEVNAALHPRAGATSVGGGLKSALEAAICAKDSDPIGDPMILLMSDGMQNSSPMVNDGAGADLTYKTLSYRNTPPGGPCPAGAAAEQRLAYGCVPVLTVYVDLPAATPAASLMQAIADQTAGANASRAQLASDPAGAFGAQLVGMLKGSTLSLLAKSLGTVAPGQQTGEAVSIDIDPTVKRLILVLGWLPVRGLENALTFSTAEGEQSLRRAVRLPARANLATAVHGQPNLRQKPYYIVLAADLPKGTTNRAFQIAPRRARVPDGGGPAIPYHLFAYAVESKFQFVPRFTPGRHGTGQPLVLNLDLSLDRVPVTGAGSSIQVSVDGPTGAIGTLLHNLGDPGGQSAPGESAKESPADKKINNLNKNADVVAQTLPKSTGQALSFSDLGGGRYQVKLNATQVPGAYVFHLAVDVNGPAGRIRRIEDVETQVEVLPDATRVQVGRGPDGSYTVNVLPLDRFDNYLGPGFDPQIQLKLPPGAGKVASVRDLRVDGSYTLQVTGVPTGVDPIAELFVTGFSVAKGPLSQLGKSPGSGGSGGAGTAGTGGGAGAGGGGVHSGRGCCGTGGSQGRGPALPVLGAVFGAAALGLLRARSRRDSKNRDLRP
jgi:hypothetical protein